MRIQLEATSYMNLPNSTLVQNMLLVDHSNSAIFTYNSNQVCPQYLRVLRYKNTTKLTRN